MWCAVHLLCSKKCSLGRVGIFNTITSYIPSFSRNPCRSVLTILLFAASLRHSRVTLEVPCNGILHPLGAHSLLSSDRLCFISFDKDWAHAHSWPDWIFWQSNRDLYFDPSEATVHVFLVHNADPSHIGVPNLGVDSVHRRKVEE